MSLRSLLRTTSTPAPEPSSVPRRPVNPLRRMPAVPRDRLAGTWREARPGRIRRSFLDAQQRDPGGWHVVGSSADVSPSRSVTRIVANREVVLWRGEDGALLAGPGACPHLGALLEDCEVMHGQVYCRWHGLALGPGARRDWLTFPALDDGVLLWLRLPTEGEALRTAPVLTERPPATWGVPVRAVFACPDARTIVMTIIDGEGTGSVVETHATLVGHDRDGRPTTVMTEATIAHSDRAGFGIARATARLLRPAVASTARQLWVDDMAYAERRWLLRDRGESYGA